MELAQQAEIKRQELCLGLISVSEVIQWADLMLESTPEYNDDLVNVSLAKHNCAQDIASLLGHLAAGSDEFDAMRVVLGSLYKFLLIDNSQTRNFTRALERFWIDHNYELPEDMQFIAGLDDVFGLAEDGIYGTRKEALDDLLQSLSTFNKIANNRAIE